MEQLFIRRLISRIINIVPFIRWHYLERINPFKDKKILVIGLSKTGTTSLHDALLLLGIESIHYPKFYHLSGDGLRFNWHWRFERARAFSDIPVVAFLDELLNRYPDSYVIYTTREKDTWLKSCESHFEFSAINPTGEALRSKVYGSRVFDSDLYSEKYDVHSNMVAERFRNHPRFLELGLEDSDKWVVLSRFLDTPIPSVEYPHSNKRSKKLAK
jgi:hypothetical protein